MTQDIQPATIRGRTKAEFTMGCLAMTAAILFALVFAALLFTSGMVPGLFVLPVPVALAYLGYKKLKSADRRMTRSTR